MEGLKNLATTKRENLFDPTIFVNAHTNDSPKIGLPVLRLMNLFGTSGNGDRFDP